MIPQNYLICATQRNGSTLLCDYLMHTGIAGIPKEEEKFFYELFYPDRIPELNITDLTLFFKDAFKRSAGYKFLWHELELLVAMLNKSNLYKNLKIYQLPIYIQKDTKYIFFERKDKLRQAISLIRAEHTHIWRKRKRTQQIKIAEPEFNNSLIDQKLALIVSREAAWKDFFHINHIIPLHISYESLLEDPKSTIKTILSFIGIKKEFKLCTDYLAQRDAITEEWVAKYRLSKIN